MFYIAFQAILIIRVHIYIQDQLVIVPASCKAVAILLQRLIQSSPPNSHLPTSSGNISHVLLDSVKSIVYIVNGQDPSIGGAKAFQMHRYMINLLLATQENYYEGEYLDSDDVLYFTISNLSKISKKVGKPLSMPIHYDRTRVAIKVYEKCKRRRLVRMKKNHGAEWVGITKMGEEATLNMIEKLREKRNLKSSKALGSQDNELAREYPYLSNEKKINLYTSYIADAYYELKKYREAIDKLDEALSLNPRNDMAYNKKGLALMKFGRYDKAVECFNKALEIDPNIAFVWMNRGNALDDSGKYEEAIKSYRKALEMEIDPDLAAEVWNNMGVCFHNMGEDEEEMRCYDKALEIERYEMSLKVNEREDYMIFVEAHTWFLKGNLLRKLRKYDKARDCYGESLKSNSTDAGTWLNKGLCFYNLGEYEEARNSYRKALEMEIDPNLASEVWNNLGVCSYDLGDYEEARKSYDRATEIDPNNAKPWYNKYKLGGRDAQKCLNRAKELGLDLDSLS